MTSVGETPITKKAVIDYLRRVEAKLYSTKVEAEIAKLEFQKQLDFFSARLSFTALIGRLNASLMREIREDLQAQARSLKVGIDNLSTSLGKLENAVQWAKAVNGITSAIGQVVKLF